MLGCLKWLKILALALSVTMTASAHSQTRILPERQTSDPRIAEIAQRLNTQFGEVRPLTIYVRESRRGGHMHPRTIVSNLQNLVLEVGGSPVERRFLAQFELAITNERVTVGGRNRETIFLTLSDLRSPGGRQIIMSSTTVLECREGTIGGFVSRENCLVDSNVLREAFARLR